MQTVLSWDVLFREKNKGISIFKLPKAKKECFEKFRDPLVQMIASNKKKSAVTVRHLVALYCTLSKRGVAFSSSAAVKQHPIARSQTIYSYHYETTVEPYFK